MQSSSRSAAPLVIDGVHYYPARVWDGSNDEGIREFLANRVDVLKAFIHAADDRFDVEVTGDGYRECLHVDLWTDEGVTEVKVPPYGVVSAQPGLEHILPSMSDRLYMELEDNSGYVSPGELLDRVDAFLMQSRAEYKHEDITYDIKLQPSAGRILFRGSECAGQAADCRIDVTWRPQHSHGAMQTDRITSTSVLVNHPCRIVLDPLLSRESLNGRF